MRSSIGALQGQGRPVFADVTLALDHSRVRSLARLASKGCRLLNIHVVVH